MSQFRTYGVIDQGCPLCKGDVSRFSLHCNKETHPYEIALSVTLYNIATLDELPGSSKRACLDFFVKKVESDPDYRAELLRFTELSLSLSKKATDKALSSEESIMASSSYFPCNCANCQRNFVDTQDAFLSTTEIGTRPPIMSGDAGIIIIERQCNCGAIVSFKMKQKRYLCEEGVERRQLYDNLEQRLVRAGVPQEYVRHTILATCHRAMRLLRRDIF